MKRLGITKFVYGAVSSTQYNTLYRFVQDGAKVDGVEMVVTRKDAVFNYGTGEVKLSDRREPVLVLTLE